MRFLRGLMPAGLAGSFFVAAAMAGEIVGKPRVLPHLAVAMLVGWLVGVAVVGLIRLFRVAPWAYPVAGLLSGPLPFLVLSAKTGEDEWGGIWLLSALFGAIVGTLECARRQRADASDGGADS